MHGHASATTHGLNLCLSMRPAEFLEANASELVGIVFATVPIYLDEASRRAVVGFLREAIAASDTFLKAFAAALIKCDPAKRSMQVSSAVNLQTATIQHQHVTDRTLCMQYVRRTINGSSHDRSVLPHTTQECVALLSWNSLLLRQLRLPAAAKAAARVVASQSGLLDSLLPHPQWARIAREPSSVLREKPALLEDYVAVARTGEQLACMHRWTTGLHCRSGFGAANLHQMRKCG